MNKFIFFFKLLDRLINIFYFILKKYCVLKFLEVNNQNII